MELTVVIGPTLVIISTLSILIGKGLVGLKLELTELKNVVKELQERVPITFIADWAIHKDRMDRMLQVIDANSSKKFIGVSNPIPEEISKLFEKKHIHGVKSLTDWEVERMIETMNDVIADSSADADEKQDAKLQVAYLEGVKAERFTWRATPQPFPAIKQPSTVKWWKAFF